MSKENISSNPVPLPEFYQRGEPMSREQFQQACRAVYRIFNIAEAEDLMSLGPSIVSRETAISDNWLTSLEDFNPELLYHSMSGLDIELDGVSYSDATLFFKQGGNRAADKNWLGDVEFHNETTEVQYKFRNSGNIEITRRSADSPWLERQWAHADTANELLEALEHLKQDSREQQIGQVALSNS